MTARNTGDGAFTAVAAGAVVTLSKLVSLGVPGAAMVTGAIAKVTRRRRQNKGGTCIEAALSE
jgi:acetyltransferase-like isoleucine patch superfamily enzyme